MITIERQGADAAPQVHRMPNVRGGICDRCGVIDPYTESVNQYKLCNHYRGVELRCSYCPSSVNPDEVIRRSIIQVAQNPDRPSEWIAWCNSPACADKHLERFKQNRT